MTYVILMCLVNLEPFIENRVVCCYGEKELSVYELSAKKLYNFHFYDWIISAKLLECGQVSFFS